jgi:type II secretory pathway component GspD/PulD (secretin)
MHPVTKNESRSRNSSLFVVMIITGFISALLPAAEALGNEPMKIEIIDLKGRTVNEVVPLLRPILAPGGVLTGRGFQLIIKTTPDNLVQIRKVLQRIDKRPEKLIIQVRFLTGSIDRNRNAEAGVRLKPGDSRFRARIYGTDNRDDSAHTQQIRAMEGSTAFIHTGQSIPVGQRTVIISGGRAQTSDTIHYKPVTTGFYVRAWVNNGHVRIAISPNRNTLSRHHGGVINTQVASTMLNGKTGEWITIGGTISHSQRRGKGTIYRTEERSQLRNTIQIRVLLAK